jgi:hypothetical protein
LSAPSSVRTSTATRFAVPPLVSHIFWPSMTYPSPSRRALVRIAATSEPSSGSDIENAPRNSPVASCGSSVSRCSSVPCWVTRWVTMKCVLITPETLIQPRAISSTTSAYVSSDSPRPPYSSGIVRPNSPISFMPATISVG